LVSKLVLETIACALLNVVSVSSKRFSDFLKSFCATPTKGRELKGETGFLSHHEDMKGLECLTSVLLLNF
jgi:hypothetical protein